MPYVNMTKDFNEVRKPVALGLTKRQILGVMAAAAAGIPLYLLLYKKMGVDSGTAVFTMVMCLMPIGFATFYTKDGLYIEKHILFYWETHVTRATERPYKTRNLYEWKERQKQLEKEVADILQKSGTVIPPDGKIDRKTKKELEKAVQKAKATGKIRKPSRMKRHSRTAYLKRNRGITRKPLHLRTSITSSWTKRTRRTGLNTGVTF